MVELVGRKVDLAEIGDLLGQLPGMEEAAVLGIDVPGVGMRLKAVVVGSDAVIRNHCRRHLPFFKAPGLIERRAALPRSPLGKVMKAELADVSGYLMAVRSASSERLL